MKRTIKLSNNVLESTFNNLRLFEQTQYCYNYIEKKFPNKTKEEITEHAEIASACFRQSFEYYNAALKASLNTSPLLYSYALNNILKGTAYLMTYDTNTISGFKSHGFSIKDDDIYDDILNSNINICSNGAVISLLKLFNDTLKKQKITFKKIIRHIPHIEEIYFKAINEIPLIALQDKNDTSKYIISGTVIPDDIEEIINQAGLYGNITGRDENCYCGFTMAGKQKLDNDTFKKDNIYYKKYLILPEKFEEGIKDVNVAFYCYLLIMSYGMLVRYNAHKWEKFVDKKSSTEAILIELSVKNAVINYYYQIHYLLFNYYYELDSYNDLDVKKVINDSTTNIMNNITKEIRHKNIQYGRDDYLPWREDWR